MINVLDYETYKNKDCSITPYCLVLYIDNNFLILYDKEKIITECLNFIVNNSNTKKIDIYIHNLNFDGFLIIYDLSKNNINYKLISNKSNIYSISVEYCEKFINFKCSYKILNESLDSLSSFENLSKLPFPYDFINKENLYYIGEVPKEEYWKNKNEYIKFLENNSTFDTKKYTIEYCKNDVILTSKIITNIFKIIDIEYKDIWKKALSSPSISHKIFFKKYNKFFIKEKILLEEQSYVRNSYFGGRCEVFGNKLDDEDIYYYDFSGMYGQCMMEDFHCGNSEFTKPNNFEKPGFYNIDYLSDDCFLPILPCFINNKLMFTNGVKNGTFWYEEIKNFIKNNGKILDIKNAIIYEKNEKVFKDFIEKFTEIRNKGGYYKKFGKLMINSLYGSMALNEERSYVFNTFSEEEYYNILKNTTVIDTYTVNNMYIIIIELDYKSKKFFSLEINNEFTQRNLSYASAISSKARTKLYNSLNEVINDGGRILYCDTDSIFAAYKKNINKFNLKFEWIEKYTDGVFIAPKIYSVKKKYEEIKIKGISTKNITFDWLKKNFYNESKIIFENQLIFEKKNFVLKQYNTSKHINLNGYDKRIFIKNKKDTKPITYNDPSLYEYYNTKKKLR